MNTTPEKKKSPWWTWPFVGLCIAVPLAAKGGAILGAVGGGGAGACFALARNNAKPVSFRVVMCSLITFACWAAFGGLMLLAHIGNELHTRRAAQAANSPEARAERLQRARDVMASMVAEDESSPASPAEKPALTLAKKQKIYAKTVRMRGMVAASQEKLEQRRRDGGNTEVHAKQLAHIRGMYEKHLEFTCTFHDLSRPELDALIREGDRAGWPAD